MSKQIDFGSLLEGLKNFPAQAGNMKAPWWFAYSYTAPGYLSISEFIYFTKTALLFQSLANGTKVIEYQVQEKLTGSFKDLIADLESKGLRQVYELKSEIEKDQQNLFLANEITGLVITSAKSKDGCELNCNFVCADVALAENLKKVIEFYIAAKDPKTLHMLSVNRFNGNTLKPIGNLAQALNRKNYNKATLEKYDYVVKQFNNQDPTGRLLILSGLPGTGKTYLVRGLLNDLVGTFLLLPPEMISDISKPQLIETISDAAKNTSNGPLYVILEDADAALVKRAGDNMDLISSLLNLGDGLLGSAFDLRIIATTNATKLEMEPAILRAGRLCSLINLEKLSVEQTNELLLVLIPKEDLEKIATKIISKSMGVFSLKDAIKTISFKEPTVLADIYAKARSLC